MADVTVSVVGMQEFERALKRLETAVGKGIRVKALQAGASIVRADASRRAPRSKRPSKAGHMADNILVKTTVNKANETQVSVGPSAKHFYGRFVEMGTSRLSARPFLRPALDENQDEVQEAIRQVLREEIMKAVGR